MQNLFHAFPGSQELQDCLRRNALSPDGGFAVANLIVNRNPLSDVFQSFFTLVNDFCKARYSRLSNQQYDLVRELAHFFSTRQFDVDGLYSLFVNCVPYLSFNS